MTAVLTAYYNGDIMYDIDKHLSKLMAGRRVNDVRLEDDHTVFEFKNGTSLEVDFDKKVITNINDNDEPSVSAPIDILVSKLVRLKKSHLQSEEGKKLEYIWDKVDQILTQIEKQLD